MNRMGYRGGQSGAMGVIPGGPLGKAKYALAMGDADEAERICRKQLERAPDNAAARVLLAQVLLQSGHAAEAADEARRVTREQPKNVEGLIVLSSALTQRGGALGGVPAEAEQAARRAVELQPKSANTRTQLADVLMRKRDFAGARREIDKAIELEPRSPSAHLMRSIIALSDKDYDGAIQSADAAIRFGRQLPPGSLAQADFIKANALIEVKRYDEALGALNSVEKQNPAMLGANGYSLRGRIYFKQRKFKDSYAQFLAAQRLSGRLRWAAPVLAGLVMVATGLFGQNAPYILVGLMAAVVLLLLWGVSLIPVVGGWLVSVLVIALGGAFAYTGLRQLQGRFFPADRSALVSGVLVSAAVALGVGAATFAVWNAIAVNWLHSKVGWFTPTSLAVAGLLAILGFTATMYGWPRLLARYSRSPQAAAA
jgi:tetratricopeptide (TPR) repeat protein